MVRYTVLSWGRGHGGGRIYHDSVYQTPDLEKQALKRTRGGCLRALLPRNKRAVSRSV
jgi:hypothetical protein